MVRDISLTLGALFKTFSVLLSHAVDVIPSMVRVAKDNRLPPKLAFSSTKITRPSFFEAAKAADKPAGPEPTISVSQ